MFVMGLAIDYKNITNTRTALQNVTDFAAIAGVAGITNKNLTDAEMEVAAKKSYDKHINLMKHKVLSDTPKINSVDGKITVNSTAIVRTSFMSLVRNNIKIHASSVARNYATGLSGGPICVLALSPDKEGAIRLQGTADLIAPTCSVHSNSTHDQGLDYVGSPTGKALSFCSAGGADTSNSAPWQPTAIVNCPVVPDPFEGRFTEENLSHADIDVNKSCFATDYLRTAGGHGFSASTWKFCGSFNLQTGTSMNFAEGSVIIFDGPATIQSGARFDAPGSTIILLGDNASLTVQAKADLQVSAPSRDSDNILSGMAFLHVNATETDRTALTIIGGGTVDVEGIMYAPLSTVYITGNGTLNGGTDYFSLIAWSVNMEGNGEFNIKAGSDHITSNMPPQPCHGDCGIDQRVILRLIE